MYSGIITTLATVVTNICLQVILSIGRAMSLVIISSLVSNSKVSEGILFHPAGHPNYMPVIYIMRPYPRHIHLLILSNCIKGKRVTIKPT